MKHWLAVYRVWNRDEREYEDDFIAAFDIDERYQEAKNLERELNFDRMCVHTLYAIRNEVQS